MVSSMGATTGDRSVSTWAATNGDNEQLSKMAASGVTAVLFRQAPPTVFIEDTQNIHQKF
jgi:hypothetical protein